MAVHVPRQHSEPPGAIEDRGAHRPAFDVGGGGVPGELSIPQLSAKTLLLAKQHLALSVQQRRAARGDLAVSPGARCGRLYPEGSAGPSR